MSRTKIRWKKQMETARHEEKEAGFGVTCGGGVEIGGGNRTSKTCKGEMEETGANYLIREEQKPGLLVGVGWK